MIEQRSICAGEVEFGVLTSGEGAPIVLLHGFPDNAWTWAAQLEALGTAGYEVFAPFLPGYAPSTLPPGGAVEIDAIVSALAALIERLAAGPASLVGHDWGATLTYALAARRPDLVSSAITIAVPHPSASARVLEFPELVAENFHHWFFQLEAVPEATLALNDFAMVDYLWQRWSTGEPDRAHLERVKRETLAAPGGVEAAIGYYRAIYQAVTSEAFALPTIEVPTLVVFGADDPHQVLVVGQEQFFAGEHRLELVEGARHFVHREQPEVVTRLIDRWASRVGTAPRGVPAASRGRGPRS
jgi:pimeloyl-ACP methyl ester carboxylesterase